MNRKLVAAIAMLAAGCSPALGFGETVSLRSEMGASVTVDRFVADQAGDRIIHAVGIYEGGSRHSYAHSPREIVTVEIDSQGSRKVYLALSSYEPVDWVLTGPGVSDVRGVYLDGYNEQSVSGVKAGIVTNRSNGMGQLNGFEPDEADGEENEWSGTAPGPSPKRISCTYTYAAPSGGGCDSALVFAANAEAIFRAKLVTYTGVYNAQEFRIRAMSGD